MNLNRAAFFIPDEKLDGELVTLSRPISALRIEPKEDGTAKLGVLAQLGPGVSVKRCGQGYDERTVKVRAEGRYYFVFLQDLDSQAVAAGK